MAKQIKKVGLLTGGGDCPGLNAAIRAVVQSACLDHGLKVVGVQDGFRGLVEKRFVDLNIENTNRIFSKGGTILGTANNYSPFAVPKAGSDKKEDLGKQAAANIRDVGIEALIVVGGDGTQAMSHQLSEEHKIPVVGIPKTIDNDLNGTNFTIGFFTAVETAVDAIDRLHTTAESHERVLVVEVMGRNAGWIALFAGLGGDADVILIPEIPYSLEKICTALSDEHHTSKRYSIVVVAEGAHEVGGSKTVQEVMQDAPDPIRLGGVGQVVAELIAQKTGRETRSMVLGHLLRGGTPCAFDRVLASRFGVAAVRAIVEGKHDTMVSYQNDTVSLVPLQTGAGKNRFVDPNSPFLQAAKKRGIVFGD